LTSFAVSQQLPHDAGAATAATVVVAAVVVVAVVVAAAAGAEVVVEERMLVVVSAGVGTCSAARARLAKETKVRAIKLFISTPVVVVPNHSATESS
jgi:hypothetical protein